MSRQDRDDEGSARLQAALRAQGEANYNLELARQERRGRLTAEAGAQPTPKQKKPATPTPSDDDALTSTYLDIDY